MQWLDSYKRWGVLLEESARLYLNKNEFEEFSRIPEVERQKQLKSLLEKPIANFSVINEVYFRARWAEVLHMLVPAKDLTLLEIASGDADMIPKTMACTHPNSKYITANMNKMLNKSLLDKTKDLNLEVKIIEKDAVDIRDEIEYNSVDIIAFQHSINDIVQAILCDREDIDTINSDWIEILPVMIKILQTEIAKNTLEKHVKDQFLKLVMELLSFLKTDGTIVMNHYMFQLDLDLGYPPELFNNFIPMTREWIKDIEGCREVFFREFDPHWWIFLKKI